MINIRIKNVSSVASRLNAIPPAIDKELQIAIGKAGFSVERESKKAISELVYNKPYKNLKRNGKPRYVRTGRLRASISTSLVGIGKASRAIISPHTNYAEYVHEGKGSNSRYGKRQYMFMGLDRAQPTVDRLLRDFKSTIERKFGS